MLVIGEVQTCLLRNSTALTRTEVAELLRLAPGERVRTSERPVAHAISPELFDGVDCMLPSEAGAKVRGIGTVTSRAVLTGGRVLQGSVHTRLDRGEYDRRLPWSHYLGRPGVVETTSQFDGPDVVAGFFGVRAAESTLGLNALGERVIARVQNSAQLDSTSPFRSSRTRLRWAVRTGEPNPSRAEFVVADGPLRTFSLALEADIGQEMVEFCEDLALHDWVLSTVSQLVERSGIGSAEGSTTLTRLRPAIDHLLHLWMPGALAADSAAIVGQRGTAAGLHQAVAGDRHPDSGPDRCAHPGNAEPLANRGAGTGLRWFGLGGPADARSALRQIVLLARFMIDFEHRLKEVEHQLVRSVEQIRQVVEDGFANVNDITRLFARVETGALKAGAVTQLMEHAGQIGPQAPPLVSTLAHDEIGRVSVFLRELAEQEAKYDGEDQQCLLGLTRNTQQGIDAISLPEVDAAGDSLPSSGSRCSGNGTWLINMRRSAEASGCAGSSSPSRLRSETMRSFSRSAALKRKSASSCGCSCRVCSMARSMILLLSTTPELRGDSSHARRIRQDALDREDAPGPAA